MLNPWRLGKQRVKEGAGDKNVSIQVTPQRPLQPGPPPTAQSAMTSSMMNPLTGTAPRDLLPSMHRRLRGTFWTEAVTHQCHTPTPRSQQQLSCDSPVYPASWWPVHQQTPIEVHGDRA